MVNRKVGVKAPLLGGTCALEDGGFHDRCFLTPALLALSAARERERDKTGSRGGDKL